MIKLSQLIFHKNFFFASYFKPVIKPLNKPAPKPISIPPMNKVLKDNQIQLATVAERLKVSQNLLKKQLINPNSDILTFDQMRMLAAINGKSYQENQKGTKKVKKSPVVTIMGHVDHGKTTLIDFLRKSNIAQKQDGGITQKIGAFHIECHGQKITFIDTPGHEAFTNMRKRGASVTDMIILIISASEGVKKQTKEVIEIINNQKIPAILAINKIDIPGVELDSVEMSAFQAGLNIETKGGNIPVVHISAKAGTNVDLLSELILEETKHLEAVETELSQGAVLQACQNNQGFYSMTLIVKKGIMKLGSLIVIGDHYTKIKHMHDDKGVPLAEGKPGDAVQIVGIPCIPTAGDLIYEVQDEKRARFIINKREMNHTLEISKNDSANILNISKIKTTSRERTALRKGIKDIWVQKYQEKENKLQEQIKELQEKAEKDSKFQELVQAKLKELQDHKKFVFETMHNIKEDKMCLNLILKFSDRGIEETILAQLDQVFEDVKAKCGMSVKILKSDVGDVIPNDLEDAQAFNARVVTFGVNLTTEADHKSKILEIYPRVHKLIHHFLQDIEQLAVQKKIQNIRGIERGKCQIAEIYDLKKNTKDKSVKTVPVPGIKVTAGKIVKQNAFFIFRGGVPQNVSPIYVKSLKTFKKEVEELKKGEEGTITFEQAEKYKFEKGDELVCYEQ